ncbi:MAG: sugar ABC transporter ATP-binding protein [Actinobacteria bacterium]|nr:sugar ABC transporter ATP-binding protein [Actinomycetota bacterium]
MTTVTDDESAVIRLRGVTIEFPGVKALQGVDLTLRAGEVHTLMGENGAGKSTLIKALTGVYPIDSGSIMVHGENRTFTGTGDAQHAGIWTVYQEVNLCANLSVGENVMLGQEISGPFGIDWKATHIEARKHLGELGLDVDTRSLLSTHSLAVQQLVAISRAMVSECSVLVLDEPTSSLDRGEVEQLFTVMRALRARGVAILFVTHFLDQVYEISDRLTVLRNGTFIGEYAAADLGRAELIELMLGRAFNELESMDAAQRVIDRSGTPVLQARSIGRRGVIEPVDLDVFDGEVVGIAGLLGSGRTELVRLMYGADRADEGAVAVRGRGLKLGRPRDSIAQRIAFTSEDRRGEGIIADLTVAENIMLGVQAKRGWLRKVSHAEQDAVVSEYIDSLGIRPASPDALLRNLSGGNQQKVVLARWLATAPQLLILDEPTRGIDVGAKADIQRLVAKLAAEGLSAIFISSELEEVLRLAQRIVVMRDRRKVAELTTTETTDVDELVAIIAQEDAA